MNIAVVLASGKGTWIKHTDRPKQFLEIGGKPILCHTVEKFLSCGQIDHVIVAVRVDWIRYTEKLFENQAYGNISVCKGADNRQESLFKALVYCQEQLHVPEDAIIVSHDAVRPFVTKEIINANIQAMNDAQAITTVIPATDTIIQSTDHAVLTGIMERSQLYQVQTPQTFHLQAYLDIYQTLDASMLSQMTDVSGIFYSQGIPVTLVQGMKENIKITTDEDLKLAEYLLHG